MSSADYVEDKLSASLLFDKREALWDYALSKLDKDGVIAEFGVWSGESINYIAARLGADNLTVYGFDSFEGLKEDWQGASLPKGSFDLHGRLPKVLKNVVLVKGWFHETIPRFLEDHADLFSFIHLDADTYESTAMVLELIGSRLKRNTVIVFDEYLGYPGWQNGEYKAWQESITKNHVQYEYLGFSNRQAAIRIKDLHL